MIIYISIDSGPDEELDTDLFSDVEEIEDWLNENYNVGSETCEYTGAQDFEQALLDATGVEADSPLRDLLDSLVFQEFLGRSYYSEEQEEAALLFLEDYGDLGEFDDSWQGKHDSDEEWAEDYLRSIYSIPDGLLEFIDFEQAAERLMDYDHTSKDSEASGVHIFFNV